MKKFAIVLFSIFIVSALSSTPDEANWPCFHGPDRDNMSAETGLLQAWPEDGPELLWSIEGIGHGYSTVSIADGRIFTAGMIEKNTYVTALDLSGETLWQTLNGQSWQAADYQTWAVPYAGARATPTVDGGKVYHLSDLGRVAAFDAKTGKELWAVDIMKTFQAEKPEYGYSESVLIDGRKLICSPAGEGGYIAALDKETGKTLWAGPALEDPVGNGSTVIAVIGGEKQYVTLSASRILSFSSEDGRLLWEFPFENARENNCADAVISSELVYGSSGYGKGSVLLRPHNKADGTWAADEIWATELLDNHHGGVLLKDGYLYGAGHNSRGWFCLDFKTGKEMWKERGKGSLTYADGHLYCLEERGTMSLVKASPDKWEETGSFKVPKGGEGFYWAHPVVCGGRLYIRHAEKMFVYKIRSD